MRRALMLILPMIGLAVSTSSAQVGSIPPAPSLESYRAHLAAASLSFRLGEPAEARRWLDAAPDDHRGWEWSCLETLLDQSRVMAGALPSGALSIAVQQNGSLAALALASGPIVLWDTKSNKSALELPGHPGGAFDVCFSPNGALLASSGVDRIARVWDAADGRLLVEFKEHKFPVTSVVFSTDGTRVFSAAYFVDKSTPIEGRVHMWRVDTGEIERTFVGGAKPLSSLALSEDGKQLAAGSWDSCAFVWSVERGGEPTQFGGKPGPMENLRINSVAISPDGALLAAGSDEKWAKVYRIADGAEIATLHGDNADVNAVLFSPDGATLATGGDDGSIRLWRSGDWSERATLCGHTLGVRALAWSRVSNTLFSTGMDRSLRAWDPEFRAYGGLRAAYGSNNYAARFSPDGSMLSCASSDGTIGLVDAATGEETARWKAHPDGEACTSAISPDGARIASCSWDKTVRVFDLRSHAEVATIRLPAGAAFMAWHPDGEIIAAALQDKTAVLVDVIDQSVVATCSGHTGAVTSVAFDSDGSRLVTGARDFASRVWRTQSGECIATISGHAGTIESAVCIADGRRIVTGSHDGSVRLWDAHTGELVRTLLASDDAIYRVAVSPNGDRIAAAGKHLYILAPDVEGPMLRTSPFEETIWHVDWSPDGRRLSVASWDGSIVVFDARDD